MNGLADYVDLTPCPYPAIVAQWEAIPLAQVATFTPEGFQRGQCFTGLGDVVDGFGFSTPQFLNAAGTGLGDIALTAPGGLFGSSDFTQWGIAEWGIIGLGVYAGLSLIGDTKRTVRRTRKAARAFRSAS